MNEVVATCKIGNRGAFSCLEKLVESNQRLLQFQILLAQLLFAALESLFALGILFLLRVESLLDLLDLAALLKQTRRWCDVVEI